MARIINIRTKPRSEYERNATPTRILATRFYIRCLESALAIGKFPRDYSLFKIEMEFRSGNWFGKNLGHQRAPLENRLSRIYAKIVYGRAAKMAELKTALAVGAWMGQPEIKMLLAEKALTGDLT